MNPKPVKIHHCVGLACFPAGLAIRPSGMKKSWKQYSDAQIDFVDGMLVAVAERLKISRVLTLD